MLFRINQLLEAGGMHFIGNSSLPLLEDRKMTHQDKEKHFETSIALMALRIRKKLFHRIFCGNLYCNVTFIKLNVTLHKKRKTNCILLLKFNFIYNT